MIEVFKRVKQKYVTTIVPEISLNSSSVTRGNNYKLKTSVPEVPNLSKIATFGKFNRNKIARLKTSVQEPNQETCLVLDHYAHHKTLTNHCNKSTYLVIDFKIN